MQRATVDTQLLSNPGIVCQRQFEGAKAMPCALSVNSQNLERTRAGAAEHQSVQQSTPLRQALGSQSVRAVQTRRLTWPACSAGRGSEHGGAGGRAGHAAIQARLAHAVHAARRCCGRNLKP